MTQVNDTYSSAKPHLGKLAKNTAIAVAQAGNTTLLEVLNMHMTSRAAVSAAVTGQNLDAFRISFKYHPDQAYILVASAGVDYTTPNWPVLKASGDLTGLAAAATGSCILDTTGVVAMLVEASSANPAGSTVSAYTGAA